ncbi:hypothetical protein D9M68_123880 [compost metagenome]
MYALLLGMTVGSIMTRELLDNGAERAQRRRRREANHPQSDGLVAKQAERPAAADLHAGACISDDGDSPDGADADGCAQP